MKEGKTIMWVMTKLLKNHPQNPSSRISSRKVKLIEESIKERGFLECMAIIAGEDFYVKEGNGRLQAAKNLGIDEVPVIFDETPMDVIISCEQATRKHNQAEMLEALHQGADLESMPKSFIKNYNKIIKYCGDHAPKYMSDRSISAAQILLIERMLIFVSRHASTVDLTQEFGFKLLQWLVSNNQAAKVRVFIEQNRDVENLLWAIDRNKPLKNV